MDSHSEISKELMDVAALAKMLNLKPFTVRKWARQGRLPIIRLGRGYRFDLQSIEQWLRSRSVAARRGDRLGGAGAQ